jgi:hypothetical protein
VFALRWRDVDLDGSTLQVRATLHFTPGGGYAFAVPKTGSCRRRIMLSGVAVRMLPRR